MRAVSVPGDLRPAQATSARSARYPGMIVIWSIADVELVGIVDTDLLRWRWGAETWRWPWVRFGSA
jgi:hypothetical protein